MAGHMCCAEVGSGFFRSSCARAGKVEREGKWYCKQHDPIAVKARREASDAKWRERNAAMQAAWKKEAEDKRKAAHHDALLKALEGLLADGCTGALSDGTLYMRDNDQSRAAVAKAISVVAAARGRQG